MEPRGRALGRPDLAALKMLAFLNMKTKLLNYHVPFARYHVVKDEDMGFFTTKNETDNLIITICRAFDVTGSYQSNVSRRSIDFQNVPLAPLKAKAVAAAMTVC